MLVFIDESGNFRPFVTNVNNFGERFVTLAATIFDDNEYKKFKTNIYSFRRNYEKYLGNKELKSHSIRRSKPKNIDLTDKDIYDFYKYGNEGEKDYYNFCNDLEKIVSETDFKIISVSCNKIVAQTLYPYMDIFTTVLTDLWERIYICHYLKKVKKSRIFFDPQMNLSDEFLRSTYQNFVDNGTNFIDKGSIGTVNLYKHIFSPNSEDSIGIQLADYCAYPIKRYLEDNKNVFFERAIKPKLHPMVNDKGRNKRVMMGLKVSLSR